MEKESGKLLREHRESIETFNSSKNLTPSFAALIKFIKVTLFICLCISGLYVMASTKLSPAKYNGTIIGKIAQPCVAKLATHYASGRPNIKHCRVELEPNRVVIIDIRYGFQPQRGDNVTLNEYKYKSLFGETYEYEFRKMGK